MVVRRFGIPLTGLVAPATVAGVALGFGAQRIVQDILAGFFIITERQYGFGDVDPHLHLGSTSGVTGTVEDVTLRLTRLRYGQRRSDHHRRTARSSRSTNLSRDWARAVVDVPVPATVDVSQVNELLRKVGERGVRRRRVAAVAARRALGHGRREHRDGPVQRPLVARTLPGKQFDVGRELRARVTIAFRRAGITVPAGLDTASPTGLDGASPTGVS